MQNVDLDADNYDALQREIIENEQELQRLAQEAINSNASLAKIEKVGGKLENVGNKYYVQCWHKASSRHCCCYWTWCGGGKNYFGFGYFHEQVKVTMGVFKDAMSEVDGQAVNTVDILFVILQRKWA